jgi:hypothetical protein
MSHFAPCPNCNRHVVTDEVVCPFCATALPEGFQAQQRPDPPRGRLSRAAMMAAGAALLGAAACSSDGGNGDGGAGSGGSMSDGAAAGSGGGGGSAVPLYGAPAPEYGAPPLGPDEG